MSFNCAKKFKKKNELLLRSASADKETFWTTHQQKTCGVRLRGVQPLFLTTSLSQISLTCSLCLIDYCQQIVAAMHRLLRIM